MENAIYQAISYVDTGVNDHILEKLQGYSQKKDK